MQNSFHRKAKKVLIIFGAIVVLGNAIFVTLPLLHKTPVAPTTGTSPDAQAVVDAATAFYTLDYTANPNLWATLACAHTTVAGCRAIHTFFAPSVKTMVQKNQIQTGCTVTPVRLVSEKGSIRVWQVTIAMTNPWPGLENPVQDAFVEVENVKGIWLMNRILFQQEIVDNLTPAP
jgi:hypothetical protein